MPLAGDLSRAFYTSRKGALQCVLLNVGQAWHGRARIDLAQRPETPLLVIGGREAAVGAPGQERRRLSCQPN